MRGFAIREHSGKIFLALMLLGLLGASPLGAAPLTFYVDILIGSDPPDRDNCVQPRDPATPFKTINGAFNSGCLLQGDTIIVKPGLYTETADVTRNFITLRAEPALGAIIQPPIAQGVIVDGVTGVIVEGFIVTGGSTGIDFKNAPNGVVRGNVVYGNGNGISFSGASSGVIESNLVHTNTGLGIRYENTTTVAGTTIVVSNNLVYANGDWGISLQPNATSVGNKVEHNTVDRNGHGVRWLVAGSGSLINNVITHNPGTGLRTFDPTKVQENFNNVFGNGSDFLAGYRAGPNTISKDPLYVDPDGPDNLLGGEEWEDDSYHLAQGGLPGQPVTSPCVDQGSVPAAAAAVDGSTAVDNLPDIGQVDLGFHYPIVRSTMKTFSLPAVSVVYDAKKREEVTASYNLQGQLGLGPNSNGINPATERLRIEVDGFSQTLPVGSCKAKGSSAWICSGQAPGVTSLQIDLGKSSFSLVIEKVPAPSIFPSSVRVRLYIADDIGVGEAAYVKGTLSAP